MAIEIKNLTFAYPRSQTPVFENFSANFPEKGITVMVGQNGAGKSTLIRCLMGILKPQQGEICIDGQNAAEMTLAQRGRLMGYVMQNPARQLFSATIEEEMQFGLKNMGLSADEIALRTETYLKMFHLAGREKEFPFNLSHGEKQRLVMAAILSMKPKYLILDEPTSGLDLKNKNQLAAYLKSVDAGVVMISHDHKFNDRVADRIFQMGEV